jgi:hypothetical protein
MQVVPFLLELGRGFFGNLLTPFFYIAILLIYLQYRRQVSLERQLFGIRVTSAEQQAIRSLGYGAVGGLAATLLISGIGIVLNPADFLYVWVLAIILAIFNLRFVCFAYAGGILSFVSLLLHAFPDMTLGWPWVANLYADLRSLSIPHLLALVAVLHLTEAILVAVQGGQSASPVFLQGKRGRLIGGYILQKYWVIPLGAIVMTGTGGFDSPAWWGLLPMIGWQGLQIFPIPAVLGFSGLALARHPQEKAVRTARWLAAYALILLGLALAGAYWSPLLWAAAIFSPVAHELLIWWEMTDEKIRQPKFAKPLQGVRILAILPNSPAEGMELKPGETIVQANGVPVNTPFDLHFAINQNPAFIKLEVVDENGENRFAGKPRFSGDHHGLGLILVPDEAAKEYVRLDSIPIWKRIWNSVSGSKHQGKSTAV